MYPSGAASEPVTVSVIVPTVDRTELLEDCLRSLTAVTLPKQHFEVVVVDAEPADTTADVCRHFSESLDVIYLRLSSSGPAVAKNAGLFAARGNILLFLDNDHVAHPGLLREHLQAHAENPGETTAVVGMAAWLPSLRQTPLMQCLTRALDNRYRALAQKQIVDAYPPLRGATSFKRSFLVRHGGFKQQLDAGLEDLELKLRLDRFGLDIVLCGNAISYVNRAVCSQEVYQLVDRSGRSRFHLNGLYHDPSVQGYCRIDELVRAWPKMANSLEGRTERIRKLEAHLAETDDRSDASLQELTGLYEELFEVLEARAVFVTANRM